MAATVIGAVAIFMAWLPYFHAKRNLEVASPSGAVPDASTLQRLHRRAAITSVLILAPLIVLSIAYAIWFWRALEADIADHARWRATTKAPSPPRVHQP